MALETAYTNECSVCGKVLLFAIHEEEEIDGVKGRRFEGPNCLYCPEDETFTCLDCVEILDE